MINFMGFSVQNRELASYRACHAKPSLADSSQGVLWLSFWCSTAQTSQVEQVSKQTTYQPTSKPTNQLINLASKHSKSSKPSKLSMRSKSKKPSKTCKPTSKPIKIQARASKLNIRNSTKVSGVQPREPRKSTTHASNQLANQPTNQPSKQASNAARKQSN